MKRTLELDIETTKKHKYEIINILDNADILEKVDIINHIYFNPIKIKFAHYIRNPDYIYKKCWNDLVVILKKLDDSITNEFRNVINPSCAYYRANKLLVFHIFDQTDLSEKQFASSMHQSNFIYEVGKIVSVNNYDTNYNNVYSTGIHYFKTIETACLYQYRSSTHAFIKMYYDNGQLYNIIEYKFSKKNGQYIEYYPNGKKKCEMNYENNKLKGAPIQYDIHENIILK